MTGQGVGAKAGSVIEKADDVTEGKPEAEVRELHEAAEHTPSPSQGGKELVAESYGDKQVNLVPYDDGYYRDQYGNKYGFDEQSNSYAPVAEDIERGLKNNFILELGTGQVPGQLERVMHMMAVDAMKTGEDQIFGQEEMTKSLNVAANLVNLAQGKNVHGLEVENIKDIFSWDGKKRSLAINDYEKFNDLVNKLHERADKLWADGKLTAKGAAAEYIGDIKKDTWGKIIKAQGLEQRVEGHKEITTEQIADVKKIEHDEIKPGGSTSSLYKELISAKAGPEIKMTGSAEQLDIPTAAGSSPEYNLMVNDGWTQSEFGGEPGNDRLWHKAVGLSDTRSVKAPAELAETPRAYSLAEKYSNEKLLLEILDKNNDYRADEVRIIHQGAVVEKYNRLQIEEMFGKENMEKTGLRLEKQVQSLMANRLREFESITESKVDLNQARECGIEIFKSGGLLPADKAKLEFIKDRGLNSDISYAKIKELFKIYDSVNDESVNLQQIDKYYDAVKDIKNPGVSARLIKVWADPSDDRNLRNLLGKLELQDPPTGFKKLTAGRRDNGDLVINYITKGYNEGNFMIIFRANGQALLERPEGVIRKFDDISDLKKVLGAPAEMLKGEQGSEAEKPTTIISEDDDVEGEQKTTIIEE